MRGAHQGHLPKFFRIAAVSNVEGQPLKPAGQPPWCERWEKVADLPSGAQAHASKVRNIESGEIGFLKVLKEQGDSARRKRFYREAKILENLQIPGVPKLLETNATFYADRSQSLYAITAFIEGQSLDSIVSKSDFSPAMATKIALDLCGIVEAAHSGNILHRDIKADNIIVSVEGDVRTHLVDFGIGHLGEEPPRFETELGVEMGNRFLRLPEYSSGLDNKADKRSDVTMIGGILFYMLTGFKPSVLVDGAGRFPHQRPKERGRLRESDFDQERLFALFDRAFHVEIDKRFQTVEQLRTALTRLGVKNTADSKHGASLERIRERLNAPSNIDKADKVATARMIMNLIKSPYVQLRDAIDGLQSFQTEYREAPDQAAVFDVVGFRVATDPSQEVRVKHTVRIHGVDALVSIQVPGRYPLRLRVPITSGDLDNEHYAAIYDYWLERINAVTSPEYAEMSRDGKDANIMRTRHEVSRRIGVLSGAVKRFFESDGGARITSVRESSFGEKDLSDSMTGGTISIGQIANESSRVRFTVTVTVAIPILPTDDWYAEEALTLAMDESGSGPEIVLRPEQVPHDAFNPAPAEISDALSRLLRVHEARLF